MQGSASVAGLGRGGVYAEQHGEGMEEQHGEGMGENELAGCMCRLLALA